MILLRGALATHTEQPEGVTIETFTTSADLTEKLERLAKQHSDKLAELKTKLGR